MADSGGPCSGSVRHSARHAGGRPCRCGVCAAARRYHHVIPHVTERSERAARQVQVSTELIFRARESAVGWRSFRPSTVPPLTQSLVKTVRLFPLDHPHAISPLRQGRLTERRIAATCREKFSRGRLLYMCSFRRIDDKPYSAITSSANWFVAKQLEGLMLLQAK